MAGISVSRLPVLIIGISLVLLTLSLLSCTCSDSSAINEKVSSQLLTQISLRKEQLANPTPDRLEIMKNMGMNILEEHSNTITLLRRGDADNSGGISIVDSGS